MILMITATPARMDWPLTGSFGIEGAAIEGLCRSMKDDEASEQTALLSALTTEHFVLQMAYSSTLSEAAGRSTLDVMALSSSELFCL